MLQLKTKTADVALGRWPGILQALGVDQKFLVNKHGPCPTCQGKDRYRFDDKGGRGTWFCSHCGSGDGFELLQKLYGWGFTQAAKEVDRVVGVVQTVAISKERTEKEKLATIAAVWKQSRKVMRGDPVWRYLNERTGIEVVPADIRFHPGMKHSAGGVYPVMLAVMRDQAGQGVSVHRTYITNEGTKAPVNPVKKFMQGKQLNGSAVRLSVIAKEIGIAEGIETALCAGVRFGLPVWAATNAVLMEAWIPPAGIKRVVICADNDESYTGQSAAFALAKRLVRDGIETDIRIPSVIGKDWADEGI